MINKYFKSKKKQPLQATPPQPVPRTMEELNKVYGEMCGRAGQLQYKISLDQYQLDQLNLAIRGVNQEADARQKLDAEAKAKEEPKTEKEVSNA